MAVLRFFNRAPETSTRAEPVLQTPPAAVGQRNRASAMAGDAGQFSGMDDPRLKEFMRTGGGSQTAAGVAVTPQSAMFNTTVLRCVSLIAFAIGMLPLHLQVKKTKENATDHPLYRLLHRKPNGWQTSFEFRAFMQQKALQDGDAIALKVMSGSRIVQLVPIVKPVTIVQKPDWSIEYHVDTGRGKKVYRQDQIFHLRYGLSDDGFTGLSLVKQAREAIALAIASETASGNMFKNGMMQGGWLKMDGVLSDEAYQRLQDQLASVRGTQNAGKYLIAEQGATPVEAKGTGREAQTVEHRKLQVEDVARPFGVPRPLLNVDDTSWGSGIDVLGQFFVRYGLNPWFEAWQQAIERSLMTDAEADIYQAKFNAGALLRGSMADQAQFFATGLGAGGHQPFLHPDEPREWLDLPRRDDLPTPAGQPNTGDTT